MEALSASSVVATVKDAVNLKLDSPFMLLASFIGLVSVTEGREGGTPLDAIARFLAGMGWQGGSGWVKAAQLWLIAPDHTEFARSLFWLLAVMGVGFAAFGTRPPFFALIGIGGLLELGASVAAWGWPAAAFVATSCVGRIRDREFSGHRWDHCAITFVRLGLALLHLPLTAITVFVGQREWSPPNTIQVELSRAGQRELDKRLTALGMPPLTPQATARTTPLPPQTRHAA